MKVKLIQATENVGKMITDIASICVVEHSPELEFMFEEVIKE